MLHLKYTSLYIFIYTYVQRLIALFPNSMYIYICTIMLCSKIG